MANDVLRSQLRAMTRGAYDLQRLRIQAGLRLCANFRSQQLGQEGGESEEDLDDDAKDILKELRQTYTRITDGIAEQVQEQEDATPHKRDVIKARFKGDGLISDYTLYKLVSHYVSLEKVEREQFNSLTKVLEDFPIYMEFLLGVRGVGPAMAAVIISEFDITRAKYVSNMWSYAGLDVAADGRGRSRRKEHLVKRQYIDAKGEPQERDSITFNPFLKTKLVGVLSGSFLKSGSSYNEHYYNYKNRIQSRQSPGTNRQPLPEGEQPWSKIRIHRAALRYMVKMFLIDLYVKWRTLEGLPVTKTYHEDKLGHVHTGNVTPPISDNRSQAAE